MNEHEVQPERQAGAHRQPGDLGGEPVRAHVLVGGLPADQDDRHQRQGADRGDGPGPLPSAIPAPTGTAATSTAVGGDTTEIGPRPVRRRTTTPNAWLTPHSAPTGSPAARSCRRPDGQQAEQHHRDRIGDQHHPQGGHPPEAMPPTKSLIPYASADASAKTTPIRTCPWRAVPVPDHLALGVPAGQVLALVVGLLYRGPAPTPP